MNARALLPLTLPLVFTLIVVVFALQAPGFLSAGNLQSLVLNNFVLLAIVAIGMTYAVAAGGIDLSVGTALDFASLSFVVLLNGGHGWAVAGTGALAAALLVGLVNAGLIAGLRISPFLATLGTLFIGTSAQQLLSDGGQPIYISQGLKPEFTGLTPLLIVLGLALFYGLALARGRWAASYWPRAPSRCWRITRGCRCGASSASWPWLPPWPVGWRACCSARQSALMCRCRVTRFCSTRLARYLSARP